MVRTVAMTHEHITTPLIQARLEGALELSDSVFDVLLDSQVVNGVNVKFVSRLGFSFPSGSSVRLKQNMTAIGQSKSDLAATVLGYCSVAVVVCEYEQ